MWKSLNRESAMMFEIPFMCWEYSDVSLLMMVYTKHITIMLWIYSLTGSNDALYSKVDLFL